MIDFNELFKKAPETQTPVKEYESIPTGVYDIEVTFAQIDLTKEPGKVKMRYKIKSGNFEGRIVFPQWALSPQGSEYLLKELIIMGQTAPTSLEDLNTKLNDLVGFMGKCKVVLRESEVNGKKYSNHNCYLIENKAASLSNKTQAPKLNEDEEIVF